ncbi:MAG TPA: DUF2269 family protein [Chryseolinea sp.]
MQLYQILKFIHVFAAIIAVGFNFSYIVWLVRGKMQKEHLLYSLRGIKLMDDRVANPCYGLALISGFAMTYVGEYNILAVSWILYPLILFGIMGLLAFGIYSPNLKKQIKIVEEYGGDSHEYKAIEKKQMLTGVILFVLAFSIVAIMVIKP